MLVDWLLVICELVTRTLSEAEVSVIGGLVTRTLVEAEACFC